MKTNTNKLAGLIIFFLTWFSFSANAQCPQFSNTLGTCTVQIKVEAYTLPGCNPVCNSYTTALANTFIGLNCAGCNCVIVRVLSLNGVPITPVTASNQTGPFSSTANNMPANPCGAATLYFDAGSNTFKLL